MKRIIVQGSSRKDGNTSKIVKVLRGYLECDLSYLSIGQYDYENRSQNDDFLTAIRKIATYDLVIFATPVYWYSMSGAMKTFFDRITDCLKIDKETGHKLRGKKMAVISCGSDSHEHEGFFIPFKKSAEYLGMNYLGNTHTWIEVNEPSNLVLQLVNNFSNKLKSNPSWCELLARNPLVYRIIHETL